MRTTLRKIGNSRGVLIPAAILNACELGDAVEMRVEDNRIIIEPAAPIHRQGWFENYQADKDSDALAEIIDSKIEQDDWEW